MGFHKVLNCKLTTYYWLHNHNIPERDFRTCYVIRWFTTFPTKPKEPRCAAHPAVLDKGLTKHDFWWTVCPHTTEAQQVHLIPLMQHCPPFFNIPNCCFTKECNFSAFGIPKHSHTKKTKNRKQHLVQMSLIQIMYDRYQYYYWTEHLILWNSAEYHRCLGTVKMCWQNRQSSELNPKSPWSYNSNSNDRPREYISDPARSYLLSTWHFVVFGPLVDS